MTVKNILYLTYDGLKDPLGKSQIIPYIKIIYKLKKKIFIYSFEKSLSKNIRKNYFESKYTNNFFYLGRLFDLIKMIIKTALIIKKENIDTLHCRGHIPAFSALLLSFLFKIKYIFDFRGFWIDERVDNGALDLSKIYTRKFYDILKKIEKKIILNSDFIICLTYKAKKIIKKKYRYKNILVIPTCCDYKFFKKNKKKNKIKKKLGLKKHVICYSGSVGNIYLVNEIVNFFKHLYYFCKEDLSLLILTNQPIEMNRIINKMKKILTYNKDIIILNKSRNQMPDYLQTSDIMMSFVKPTWARQASFPTKIAEAFALNIPVISIRGVGDIDHILKTFNSGFSISLSDINSSNRAIKLFNQSLKLKKKKMIRKNTQRSFDLSFALDSYNKIYNKIL